MFAVLVASDTKINHCPAQKDSPCLQRTNQDCQCATLEILYIFYPTFFCKDATSLFVHFLHFSKAIRFLPILQNPRANSGTKLKLRLATVWKCFAVLNILMRSLIDLAAGCIRVLLSPQYVFQYVFQILGGSFTLSPVLILYSKIDPTSWLLCFARKLIPCVYLSEDQSHGKSFLHDKLLNDLTHEKYIKRDVQLQYFRFIMKAPTLLYD